MPYPRVISEDETIEQALAGRSLSRFGDGELRVALGGRAASQKADAKLAEELKAILADERTALVCIPNLDPRSPKSKNWSKYSGEKFTKLYGMPLYGSSFVTRPDSAPWINRPDYWEKVEQLWRGKDVTIVTGEPEGSGKMFGIGVGANVARRVQAPRQHAYAEIDRIEREIMSQVPGTVLLCLGATATVLAVRLARRGVRAIDLGHMGMFLRRREKPEQTLKRIRGDKSYDAAN